MFYLESSCARVQWDTGGGRHHLHVVRLLRGLHLQRAGNVNSERIYHLCGGVVKTRGVCCGGKGLGMYSDTLARVHWDPGGGRHLLHVFFTDPRISDSKQ